ncbi:LuxR C-terminal-related transcriptional regulator [Lentzea sp. BCCO 10_0061]|uniref:LuxR C-terminal-related transcriptional regulator n=1 Tax=Lentzea sokolovensis TaxID=3095429 RepID=A0ABU4VCK0_9PSEU|nr:LuxR C-terminal-related transcriptional regulator [Lentzea sp. BCCO 10_0061]MDX8149497.1 LuxR C-terminal-related transcriptional regulator [Lentzea sp. BCCO 10_0061]
MDLKTSLPSEETSFVGRRAELAEAKALLAASRLLTLTGPGGIGKTRLALRLARQVSRAFADGVRLLRVDTVQDTDLLPQAMAVELGLRDVGRDAPVKIIDFLRDKELLLVLDNCEHLAEACGVLAGRILAAAPGVRVLATSRHVLRAEAEHLLPVGPLPVPTAADGRAAAARTDAVVLFRQRAVQAGVLAGPEDHAAVARICRQLDGIPLAIELCAAWVRHMSLAEILTRLDDRFALLGADGVEVPARHRSLAAAVEWSYERCSAEEQTLWTRLSVCSGGFTLAAAAAVGLAADLPREDLVGLIAGLVDKSIVTRDRTVRGSARYRMLETLREFGLSRLTAREERAARIRHRDHLVGQVDQWSLEWFGPDQVEIVGLTRADHANLRSALQFCLDDPAQAPLGARLVASMSYYWTNCGLFGEARWWVDRALLVEDLSPDVRFHTLWLSAYTALGLGDQDRSIDESSQAEAVARGAGDPGRIALALAVRAFVLGVFEGDPIAADACYAEAISRFGDAPELGGYLVLTHAGRAMVAGLSGNQVQAAASARQAIELAEVRGELCHRSYALYGLALAEWQLGNWPEAAANAKSAVRLKHRFGDFNGLALAVQLLAWIASASGDFTRAANLLGVGERIWTFTGGKAMLDSDAWIVPNTACREVVVGRLGQRRFESAFREGIDRGGDLDDAVDYVLGAQASSGQAPPELTAQELRVAQLIAEGVGNRTIASRLLIAQRTAQVHVENILGKLGFSSRAQIASWVVQRRLDDQQLPVLEDD